MSPLHMLKTVLTVACLGATLSACAYSTVDTGTFVTVPTDKGRVVVDVAAYKGVTPERVGFADFSEREEYTLYRSPKGQAEFLYTETRRENGRNIVLDFDKLIADSVRMWRFNAGHQLNFGASQAIETNLTQFWVQPYKQTDTGRNCVGFSARWDFRPDDPYLRPTKILFGYHCVPAGTPLSVADAQAFVKAIDVRGISIPLRVKTAYDLKKGDAPLPSKQVQTEYLVRAQDGAGGGVSGLPGFPLLISRYYSEHDGNVYDK